MSHDRDDLRSARREPPGGRRFSRRVLKGPRTAEEYLKADSPPAYMRRLRAMELEFQSQRRALEHAYEALRAECGHDAGTFSDRWRARAQAWRFEPLNRLIRDHNAWYPAEANLPMDPRIRDFVPIGGKSYRRIELTPEWVLEHFPADPERADGRRIPSTVPRQSHGGRRRTKGIR